MTQCIKSLMKGLPHNLKVKIGYVEENKTALKPCLIYYTIPICLLPLSRLLGHIFVTKAYGFIRRGDI